MDRLELLTSLIGVYVAQPATAFWRAIELDAIQRLGMPAGRGLDIGCGDGKLTEILLRSIGGRRLVGVDLDALETAAAAGYDFYEAVHTAPADRIPEQSESFDFAVSNSVLEHIPDLEAVLRETARLLRPGGTFTFTVPGIGFHPALRGGVLPGVTRDRYLRIIDDRLAHIHYLSAEEWAATCEKVGLRVETCLGYMAPQEVRRWETLSRFTGGLLYTLFGNRARPIEIQRRFGVRQLQNTHRMPEALAAVVAKWVAAGMDFRADGSRWLDERNAGCLLVHGVKP
jgi:SAM-dependent methyltransferase